MISCHWSPSLSCTKWCYHSVVEASNKSYQTALFSTYTVYKVLSTWVCGWSVKISIKPRLSSSMVCYFVCAKTAHPTSESPSEWNPHSNESYSEDNAGISYCIPVSYHCCGYLPYIASFPEFIMAYKVIPTSQSENWTQTFNHHKQKLLGSIFR